MKAHRRIIDFLGLRRSVVALLDMVILVGMGEKLGERFLPIYILALGGTAYAIGLLNGLDNLLSALVLVPRRLSQRQDRVQACAGRFQPGVDARLRHRHRCSPRGRR